jgi:hypothetical protein
MVQIVNSDVIQNLVNDCGLQSANGVPTQLSNQVVPVVNITPRQISNVAIGGTNSGTGAVTLYTTPVDRDFYLTSASVGYAKSAACDMGDGFIYLKVYIRGLQVNVCIAPAMALTAEKNNVAISYTAPLKLDRNSTITIAAQSFTAGALLRMGTFTGFCEKQ